MRHFILNVHQGIALHSPETRVFRHPVLLEIAFYISFLLFGLAENIFTTGHVMRSEI
jgi:hypothetical protein